MRLQPTTENPYLLAAGVGAIAGLRSMTAPTWVACAQDARLKRLLAVAATGEMIVDKLPFVPDRIRAPLLFGRALSGACSSYFVARNGSSRKAPSPYLLAALGGAAALASSFGAFYLRRWLGRRLKVSDRIIGTAEDALALGAGAALFRTSA